MRHYDLFYLINLILNIIENIFDVFNQLHEKYIRLNDKNNTQISK